MCRRGAYRALWRRAAEGTLWCVRSSAEQSIVRSRPCAAARKAHQALLGQGAARSPPAEALRASPAAGGAQDSPPQVWRPRARQMREDYAPQPQLTLQRSVQQTEVPARRCRAAASRRATGGVRCDTGAERKRIMRRRQSGWHKPSDENRGDEEGHGHGLERGASAQRRVGSLGHHCTRQREVRHHTRAVQLRHSREPSYERHVLLLPWQGTPPPQLA